jgi:hypothetical protein
MSWLVHTKQLTEDQSNILTYIQRGYKHKQTKEGNKMTRKQIKQLSKYLIEKTSGQFHYEEDYWKEFFSKKEAKQCSLLIYPIW